VVDEVRRYFGERVYRTIIPRTVSLSEAPGFAQPITAYDPVSKGAQRYRELATEVADHLPDESPLPSMDDLPTVVVPAPEPHPARAPRPMVREEEMEEGAGPRSTKPMPPEPPDPEPHEESIGEKPSLELGLEPEVPVEEQAGLVASETGTGTGTTSTAGQPMRVSPTGEDASTAPPEPLPIATSPMQDAESESVAEVAASNGAASPVEDWVRELETEGTIEPETPTAGQEKRPERGPAKESVPGGEAEPGSVVVIDEGSARERAPSQGEPKPEPERKGLRGLFRRGGDR
jgi:hypothetical protein